ncbi:MAG: multidrug ABC transporter permease [Aerococcus sp.]|nr:multidrug ABC transporter permease [Aerococcus sp.]
MRQFIGLSTFHLKLFAKNSYFFWLMITSTISLLFLQYLAAYAGNSLSDPYLWRRAAIFGLWSCGTTACGSIGFERAQGTLLYLLNNRVSDRVSLAAVIVPAASFGLLCFPLAFGVGSLLQLNKTISSVWQLLFWMGALWIGAMILDFAIAGLFVLTPRALVYEEIVTLPLLFGSGLFQLPPTLQWIEQLERWVVPIASPIQALTGQPSYQTFVLPYAVSLLGWSAISYYLSTTLINQAKRKGRLGGIGL